MGSKPQFPKCFWCFFLLHHKLFFRLSAIVTNPPLKSFLSQASLIFKLKPISFLTDHPCIERLMYKHLIHHTWTLDNWISCMGIMELYSVPPGFRRPFLRLLRPKMPDVAWAFQKVAMKFALFFRFLLRLQCERKWKLRKKLWKLQISWC